MKLWPVTKTYLVIVSPLCKKKLDSQKSNGTSGSAGPNLKLSRLVGNVTPYATLEHTLERGPVEMHYGPGRMDVLN